MTVGRFRSGYRAISGTSGIYVPKYFSGGYAQKILGTSPDNLIAYWQLNETGGTNAVNSEGTAARDGTYTGVTLNNSTGPDGQPVGLWDGINDYCDIYSASLNTAFNGAEGTFAMWVKVSGAGVWTDGVQRYIFRLRVDGDNEIYAFRSVTNNRYDFKYEAGNVSEFGPITGVATTDWFHIAMTWSKTGDKVKYYQDGVSASADDSTLGVWAGNLAAANTIIGSNSTTPANPFSGYIAHVPIWSIALAPAQIANLAVV